MPMYSQTTSPASLAKLSPLSFLSVHYNTYLFILASNNLAQNQELFAGKGSKISFPSHSGFVAPLIQLQGNKCIQCFIGSDNG